MVIAEYKKRDTATPMVTLQKCSKGCSISMYFETLENQWNLFLSIFEAA